MLKIQQLAFSIFILQEQRKIRTFINAALTSMFFLLERSSGKLVTKREMENLEHVSSLLEKTVGISNH